jgi:hypothetical protein
MLTFPRSRIIGDADNQVRLSQSWASLTAHLARLAPEIELKQQAVSVCSLSLVNTARIV